MSDAVYITAVDVISTLNHTYEEFKNVLYSGKESSPDKQQIDFTAMKKKYAKKVRRMNRASVLAFLSSSQAFFQRELEKIPYDGCDIGTVYSVFSPSLDSSLAVLNTLYEKGIDLVSPIMFSSTVGNACIAGVTTEYQLKGQSIMIRSANALNYSLSLLKAAKAEILFCGSYDVYIPEMLAYYQSRSFTAKDTAERAIPCERKTKGIQLKECGVTLLLERAESPYLDKSKIFCEICGSGIVRKTSSDKEAVGEFQKEDFKESMERALDKAGIRPDKVSVVISAAGGHPALDAAEERAIHDIFGEKPYVISIKGLFGDSLGSNLMLNTAAAATIIREKRLPKSYGSEKNPAAIHLTLEEAREDFSYVMANGYGEEGSVISVILKSADIRS